WVIGFFTLIFFHPGERLSWWQTAGFVIGSSIAGMLYLAGVISWAIFGAVSRDLESIQRQNKEIIDLLKQIARGGGVQAAPPPRPEVFLPPSPAGPPDGITVRPGSPRPPSDDLPPPPPPADGPPGLEEFGP